MDLEHLDNYAKIKGINLLGTGDFTHPKWIEELKSKLTQAEQGLFHYKNKEMFYMLTSEISLIYSQGGKGRRVHIVLLAPSFEIVEQITDWLKTKGRVDYDGRPIFGFSASELVENMMQISKDIEIIPAHIWTPWFGLLGSKSGFDSFQECFQDQTKHIHALETGLSSDPSMNWRVSSLDKFSILSFSDSHSFWSWRLGRELTMFDCKPTYKDIINSIRTKSGIKQTIEVDPNYGKYHWDGHRACNVFFSPSQTKELNGICPACKKPLTVGVEYRVEELADRPEGYTPKNPTPFKRLIPLSEIISAVFSSGITSKKVQLEHDNLIKNFNSELNILLKTSKDDLLKITDQKIAKTIILNREGKLKIQPGYDGVYGKLILDESKQIKETKYTPSQKSLSEF